MLQQKHVLMDLDFGDAGGGYRVISQNKKSTQKQPSLFTKILNYFFRKQ